MFLLVAVAMIGSQATMPGAEEPVFSYSIRRPDREIFFSLHEQAIPQISWDGETDPPLTYAEAVAIGRRALGEIFEDSHERPVASVGLQRLLPDSNRWYYEITFGQAKVGRRFGPSVPLRVVVLMNGTYLKPDRVVMDGK
jgi:hypothetical protein